MQKIEFTPETRDEYGKQNSDERLFPDGSPNPWYKGGNPVNYKLVDQHLPVPPRTFHEKWPIFFVLFLLSIIVS